MKARAKDPSPNASNLKVIAPARESFEELSVSPGIGVLRERLANSGYLVCAQRDLGLPSKVNDFFSVKFFNYLNALSATERRGPVQGQDAIAYGRMDGELITSPALSVPGEQRGGARGTSEPVRMSTEGDRCMQKLIGSLLSVVPERDQRTAGTFSMHFNRGELSQSFSPQQRDADYVILYNLKNGGRPLPLRLSVDPDGLNVPFSCDLQEGELLIIKDEAFFHSLRPSIVRSGYGWGSETLLMTVDRMD